MALLSSRINNFKKLVILGQSCKKTICTSSASYKIFTVQDEDDFKKSVVDSKEPVVIQFKASWCGPCKLLEPRMVNIIGSKNEKVHLALVDINENPSIGDDFNVDSVPTVIGFKNGNAESKFIGLKDEDEIESFVDKLIGN